MDCAICGASLEGVAVTKELSGRPGEYHRCPRCGSLVLVPLPAADAINAYFCEDDPVRSLTAASLMRHDYFGKRLDLLEPARRRSRTPRLLEIGCGCGVLLDLAVQRGWSVEAYELSPKLARLARERAVGAVVHEADFLARESEEPESFDAVVAIDVLEHMLSPRRFLEKTRRLLVPGGLLLLQTPNARSLRARLEGKHWCELVAQYHFHLFSGEGLRGLLERTGFMPVRMVTISGNGMEKGTARLLADAKQRLLSVFSLGNAFLMLACAGPSRVGPGRLSQGEIR